MGHLRHLVLLKSDGGAVGCGDNKSGQWDLPGPGADLGDVQVAAGARHTVLLRSVGGGTGGGGNESSQCNLPVPIAGLRYAQVPAERGTQSCSGAMAAPRAAATTRSGSATFLR